MAVTKMLDDMIEVRATIDIGGLLVIESMVESACKDKLVKGNITLKQQQGTTIQTLLILGVGERN